MQECQNYRTIIPSHTSKAMLEIKLNRPKSRAERIITEEQAGLRAGRSTTDQIVNSRILFEKYLQHQQDLYHGFKKTFYRVRHEALWVTIKKYNINAKLIWVIKHLYGRAIIFNGSIGDWFRTKVEVRQGCLL